ncbi:MAG: hypothetical protein ACW99G_19215 [Candidatus Thorarchaeota archaeon]|jgi:hypothetical protein
MKPSKTPLHPGFYTADEFRTMRTESGVVAIDSLLEGGIESGLVHLFYGDKRLHQDFLRFAVKAQTSRKSGGLESPTIIIDSANMIRIERLTELSYQLDLEPETVMDNIYISRAFNSSQTYDLIMTQMENFLDKIPARVLMITGLPNLYLEEGLKSEGLQQISHMSSKIAAVTLQRGLFTLVSVPPSSRSPNYPEGGRTLSTSAQVHVQVTDSPSRTTYTLAKHPQFPVRRTNRAKSEPSGDTLPLSHFLRGEERELE